LPLPSPTLVTPQPLDIAYLDPHLLIAVKPSGLLSVPGRGPDKQDCLIARLRREIPDALVVHRLDMPTSGLMIFARGQEAQRRLSAAFAERAIHKKYIAVVAGHMISDQGQVDLPLLTDWPNRPLQKIDHDIGKPALTHYTVLQRQASDCTRALLEPITGRTHQLRVHLWALGHPILGDMLYAPPAIQNQSARLLLHASTLQLTHPFTDKLLQFQHEPPF
jgi:tRNA pseudouridine32 synthase / 23S rRNA pseudouridine746 synthase